MKISVAGKSALRELSPLEQIAARNAALAALAALQLDNVAGNVSLYQALLACDPTVQNQIALKSLAIQSEVGNPLWHSRLNLVAKDPKEAVQKINEVCSNAGLEAVLAELLVCDKGIWSAIPIPVETALDQDSQDSEEPYKPPTTPPLPPPSFP